MKLQLLSDLHLEFADYSYPACNADVVVLAGDIHVKGRAVAWIEKHIPHIPVIYVLGNHEFYGTTHPKLIAEIKASISAPNIHVLEQEVLTLDGINFLGCTLWTNFELFGDPRIAGYHCQQIMNDYRKIRKLPNYSKLRSLDTAILHRHALDWLTKRLESLSGQSNVVITHHAPSLHSVPDSRKNDLTTAAYVSNLDSIILQHQPRCWLHGHLHHSADYWLGACQVVCNPKGYPGEENSQFDPVKLIEV